MYAKMLMFLHVLLLQACAHLDIFQKIISTNV